MSLLTLERNSPSPQDSEVEETLSTSSHEGFVAREHCITSLPPRPWASLGRHGGEELQIFTHLKKVLKLLRSSDTIKLAVELENAFPRSVTKYLVVVTTNGYQDTEEAIVLGTEQEDSIIRLCLVRPLWTDTEIKLDGDGGFSVHSGDRQAIFKPSSVQSMWTTLQMLYQITATARQNNYYVGGLSHTWLSYYQSHVTEDYIIRNEWNLVKDIESFRPDSPIYSSQMTTPAGSKFEKQLVVKLREVMMHEDLEEVTSRQLRLKLEEETGMELKDYREFLDRHMLRILGQMEQPSQILDYLYLGSEWNASNLNELKEKGVGYILNITREIDNFYPEVFKYLNIRLYDLPDSELIKHWDKSYRFIKEAKVVGTKVLVHCKMGISRSAATVIAYMMKEYRMTLLEAKRHVKGIRSCINPNEGFMTQLKAYEGILTARHNPQWGRQAPSRHPSILLSRSMSDPDLLQTMEKEQLEMKDLEREQQVHMEELAAGAGKGWGKEWQHRFTFVHTRPIHNVASVSNIACLTSHYPTQSEEPELTFLPEEEEREREQLTAETPSGAVAGSSRLYEGDLLTHSTPVDKTHYIRNFLASLPPSLSNTTDDGIGDNIPTSNSGSADSTPMYTPPDEEHFHMHMSHQNSSDGSSSHLEEHVPGEQECPSNEESCEKESDRHQQATATTARQPATGVPLKPAPPPTMTKSSPSPSGLELNIIPLQVQTSSSMPLLLHTYRSNSLPRTLGCNMRDGKMITISPASSKSSLSSIARYSPALLEEEGNGEADVGVKRAEGSKKGEKVISTSRFLSDSIGEADTQSDPLSEEDRVFLHRRAKSDTCDTSGPIRTAQISSVPERVKEIEERNLHVASTRQKATPSPDSAAHVLTTSLHDKPSPLDSSVSQASSEESLPLHNDAPGDPEKPPPDFSPVPDVPTRHASLSPRPSSSRAFLSSAPPQASQSLPASVSPPPENDSTTSPPVNSQEQLTNSLHGGVKAKIKDIEGKKSPNIQNGAQFDPSKGETVVKRSTSTSLSKRPYSEIIYHNPYIGMVEVSNNPPFSSTAQGTEFKPQKVTANKSPLSRRKGSLCSTMYPSGGGREQSGQDWVQSEALYKAWAGMLPKEKLPVDVAGVLELKQRFELSKTNSPLERRASANLRRSSSLRDTRLLSPPQRLGGSSQGKHYASNTTFFVNSFHSDSSPVTGSTDQTSRNSLRRKMFSLSGKSE